MKRFVWRLDAELQYEALEITGLREKAQMWMDRAQIYRLKGDESQAIQAIIIATGFAQVADTRARALFAW